MAESEFDPDNMSRDDYKTLLLGWIAEHAPDDSMFDAIAYYRMALIIARDYLPALLANGDWKTAAVEVLQYLIDTKEQ